MPGYLYLICCFLIMPSPAMAVLWPVVTEYRFEGYSSTKSALYSVVSTQLVEIGEPTVTKDSIDPPVVRGAWCGDSNCFYSGGIPGNQLKLSNCDFVERKSWDLKPGSTCDVSGIFAVMGEGVSACVIIGIPVYTGQLALYLPTGVVSANTAINGGKCARTPPPEVNCTVELPPSIRHGDLSVGASDTKYIEGFVECGASPVVYVVGSSDITLAPGVSTRISTSISNGTSVRLQSDMTVDASAAEGDYSAAIVIAVSPN